MDFYNTGFCVDIFVKSPIYTKLSGNGLHGFFKGEGPESTSRVDRTATLKPPLFLLDKYAGEHIQVPAFTECQGIPHKVR